MRRPARRLFTLCSVVSLLLLVAVCAAWVRSYSVVDRVGRVWFSPHIDDEDHHQYLYANWGVAHLSVGGDPAENFAEVRWHWDRYPAYRSGYLGADQPRALEAIGVGWSRRRTLGSGETSWDVGVRLAPTAGVLALATVLFGWRAWRTTRRRRGHCAGCGYDLRASPGRCPECGTAASYARPPERGPSDLTTAPRVGLTEQERGAK